MFSKQHSHIALVVALSSFVGFACTSPAPAALLDGQQVTWQEAYPTQTSINFTWGPLTVGPGPELTVQGVPTLIDFSVDISDQQVRIDFPHNYQAATGTFNGYILSDSASVAPFETVNLDPGTTLAGMTSSRITFDPHDIFFNVSSLPVAGGSSIVVDINSVPEPSSLVLVVLAAIGAAILFRQRLWVGTTSIRQKGN
jgi:hypothetical protein